MKEDLEKVLKEQIEPIIEYNLQKYIGATIKELSKDITDVLGNNLLLDFEIDTTQKFKLAKKIFKRAYLEKLLKLCCGDVTEASRVAGIDRRSIHRFIKEFRINVGKFRADAFRPEYIHKKAVNASIKNILENYQNIIHPKKLSRMYRNVPQLSEEILKEMPLQFPRLAEAERQFEIAFLTKAMKDNNWNVSKTASRIGLRTETLFRKINELGLRATIQK